MVLTYFQNHVVTISYDDEAQLGIAEWNGFLNTHEFREAITACLALMEEHKPLRWLGDNRKMKAIRQVDQEWFVEEVLPRLYASSLRRNATLVSEDFFNKTAVEQMYKRAEGLGDLVTKEFGNKPHAMAWLLEPVSSALQQQG
ncbi:hypothetical protein [Rufibacter quisquiliarum]|uniref:Uncharacterized protein n=1 Tax=Rufibacter quisquiliarum TaxID=1549639 RepID=A0A839GXH6_9BACT|nr:hypothetical protein [Rufibacter quisquiliarum]MBA9078421.1 hypothetical protein [Rufibacter quisquiliarum]